MQNFVGKTKCIVGYMKVADCSLIQIKCARLPLMWPGFDSGSKYVWAEFLVDSRFSPRFSSPDFPVFTSWYDVSHAMRYRVWGAKFN